MKWTKSDGTLDLDALDALEASVRVVTDSNKSIDAVLKAAKIGAPTVIAFRCSHSRMFYPHDFAKQWGRDYGIGLGASPVSESLDSMYGISASETQYATKLEHFMHPVQTSCAQVDFVVVPEEEYSAALLIPQQQDLDMVLRSRIIFEKQMNSENGRLRMLVANYNSLRAKKAVVK